jgi:hypothetical protein
MAEFLLYPSSHGTDELLHSIAVQYQGAVLGDTHSVATQISGKLFSIWERSRRSFIEA